MVGAGLLAPAPVAPERKVRNAKGWAQRVANEEAGGRREYRRDERALVVAQYWCTSPSPPTSRKHVPWRSQSSIALDRN